MPCLLHEIHPPGTGPMRRLDKCVRTRAYKCIHTHMYLHYCQHLCVCTYVSVALTNSCQSTPCIPPLRRPLGGGGVCVCVGCTFTTQAGANKSRQRRNNYTGRVCVCVASCTHAGVQRIITSSSSSRAARTGTGTVVWLNVRFGTAYINGCDF